MPFWCSSYLYGSRGISDGRENLGIEVKIETQGGAGVENELNAKDIEEAVCVVLVNDVAIKGVERFKGKKVVKMGVSDIIKKAEPLMVKIQKTFG